MWSISRCDHSHRPWNIQNEFECIDTDLCEGGEVNTSDFSAKPEQTIPMLDMDLEEVMFEVSWRSKFKFRNKVSHSFSMTYPIILIQVEGNENFPCDFCKKVCKSKGGLTKHQRSKHVDALGESSTLSFAADLVTAQKPGLRDIGQYLTATKL